MSEMPLFDKAAGQARKERGQARVSEHNRRWLEDVRAAMVAQSLLRGRVTADDVRRWCKQQYRYPDHDNCYGAVFKPKFSALNPQRGGWKAVGWTVSSTASRHAAAIRVWFYELP